MKGTGIPSISYSAWMCAQWEFSSRWQERSLPMRASFPPLSQECVAQPVRVRKVGGVQQGAPLSRAILEGAPHDRGDAHRPVLLLERTVMRTGRADIIIERPAGSGRDHFGVHRHEQNVAIFPKRRRRATLARAEEPASGRCSKPRARRWSRVPCHRTPIRR